MADEKTELRNRLERLTRAISLVYGIETKQELFEIMTHSLALAHTVVLQGGGVPDDEKAKEHFGSPLHRQQVDAAFQTFAQTVAAVDDFFDALVNPRQLLGVDPETMEVFVLKADPIPDEPYPPAGKGRGGETLQ